jgi:acetyltransferase-like isoleucine patch superfamily enzyme
MLTFDSSDLLSIFAETEQVIRPYGNHRIVLNPFSDISSSHVKGPVFLDRYAKVNRSQLDGFFGLGCFSYLRNAMVGRYVHIGARVSVGGFNHPTNWLSTATFQYQAWTELWYGESDKDELSSPRQYIPDKDFVEIGPDVWIGDNAVIVAGVEVGIGTIVGAGSVVTKSTPPFSIVAGNPARVIKYRFTEGQRQDLLKLRWWELTPKELIGIHFEDIESAIRDVHERRLVLAKD